MDKNEAGNLDQVMKKALCTTTAELHFQQYPVFQLAPKKPTHTRITYTEKTQKDGAPLIRRWAVQVTDHHGWPGEFEAEVWRSIEHIAHLRQMQGTLSNPIRTSFGEIKQYMPAKGTGGANWCRIKKALSCLGNTGVESNLFYDGKKEIEAGGVEFTLIASLHYHKKQLRNGLEIMDGVSIELPDDLFENIQKRYVRPIDKGFRDGLEKWIAKRLYELLGVKFYALQKKRTPYRTRYSRLCGLLGIVQQQRLSWARRVLGRAHHELEQLGFLLKVEWFPVRNETHDWVLAFWPGPRAKAEWQKDYWRNVEIPEPLFVEQLPGTESQPVWVDELASDESAILGDLDSDSPPEEVPLIVEVLSDEPEQLSLLSALSTPSFSDEPVVFPPELDEKSKPMPETSEPAPSHEAEEAPYTKMALEAFEQATGKHRRLPRLTDAERKRLAEWEAAGVTASDIVSGTRKALAKQGAWENESGKRGRDIVSLAYVNGQVRDACIKRQKLERESVELGILDMTRTSQSKELRNAEAEFRVVFLQSGDPRDAEAKGILLESLVLVERTAQAAVFLVANSAIAGDIDLYWKESLAQAVGRPAAEILIPMAWLQRATARQGGKRG